MPSTISNLGADDQEQKPAAASSVGNAFERIHALGYTRLCPVIPPGAPISERSSLFKRLARGEDSRGKSPGIKWPDGTWSGFDFVAHESTIADLPRWHAMGAGVGIKTGRGLALIDADATVPEHAAIIEAAVNRHFGALPIRIGRAPKAGYLVRVSGDFTYSRVEFGVADAPPGDKNRRKADRVEILYEGRQFVAHGIHPATGRPYHWPDGMPAYEDIPQTAGAALHTFLADLAAVLPGARGVVHEGGAAAPPQASLRGDPALVRKAVSCIPNTSEHFGAREDYVKMGYAIKAAIGPDHEAEGLDIFQDWCARWVDGTNEPDVVVADWSRLKAPFKVGAPWLFDLAERHGDGQFNAAEQWFEPIGEHEPLFPDQGGLANADAERADAFDLTSFEEAAATALCASAKPLVKGLMDQGAMTVLYGASNTGKTFVAMDLAWHVAAGQTWGGMKVAAGFHVVYVAAEGGLGARKRAAALQQVRGNAARGRFHFLLKPVDLLHANADLKPLIATVRRVEGAVGLVVIDTLSRAMAGGDENTSTDMGVLVKHLDTLRKETGAHLLAVHHSGKDALKGARGWSGLRAATDTEIEIADGQITVTKQRDLDQAWRRAFSLDQVELGRDADGDPVTSCVIRLLDGREGAQLSDEELASLQQAVGETEWRVRDNGRGAVPAEWIGVPIAGALGLDLSQTAEKAQVQRVQRELQGLGVIREVHRSRGKRLVWGRMPQSPASWFEPQPPDLPLIPATAAGGLVPAVDLFG